MSIAFRKICKLCEISTKLYREQYHKATQPQEYQGFRMSKTKPRSSLLTLQFPCCQENSLQRK